MIDWKIIDLAIDYVIEWVKNLKPSVTCHQCGEPIYWFQFVPESWSYIYGTVFFHRSCWGKE